MGKTYILVINTFRHMQNLTTTGHVHLKEKKTAEARRNWLYFKNNGKVVRDGGQTHSFLYNFKSLHGPEGVDADHG